MVWPCLAPFQTPIAAWIYRTTALRRGDEDRESGALVLTPEWSVYMQGDVWLILRQVLLNVGTSRNYMPTVRLSTERGEARVWAYRHYHNLALAQPTA